MVKNEAVTEAILEAKEWEGELDDAHLMAVSGGNFTTDLVNQANSIGASYSDLGKTLGQKYTALGQYFSAEFSYNG
ncbi:hypothetical protein AB0758_32855 [Tolypothrix bouteillei VB521301_2]|uniref:Uncharacterized protein n=1 Tax=Tolypothrix bouteillei VB521301 TaxID=1479485 RepID=A0A0C1RL24_9CYAN